MRIVVSCVKFLQVASTVAKVISGKDVQEQMVFAVEKDRLVLTAYSSSAFFRGSVGFSSSSGVGDGGCWSVSGLQLKTFLSILPKDDASELVFEISADGRLFNIEFPKGRFKLPVSEAPARVPVEDVESVGLVSPVDFVDSVQTLVKLCATDEAVRDHALSCLHVFGRGNSLVFMSTNTVALVEKRIGLVDCGEDFTVLLSPAQAGLLVGRVDVDESISLVQTATKFGYVDKFGTLCLVSKSDRQPLQYESFKSKISVRERVQLLKSEFSYGIESMAKLCPSFAELRFNVGGGNVVVKNYNEDSVTVPCVEGGERASSMKLLKPSLSILCHVLSDKFNMCWEGDDGQRIVSFQCLNDDGVVDEDLFIIITTNN